MFLSSLRRRDFEVDGMVDFCPEPWAAIAYGISCLHLDDIDSDDLLVVARENPGYIQEDLRAKGFNHVWAYYNLDLDFLQTPVEESYLRQWF